MSALLRFAPWVLGATLLASFAACTGEVTSSSSTGTGGGGSGSGGAGGVAGGFASSSSGTGGAGGEPVVILTCPEEVTTFETECDFLNQDCPPDQACYPVESGGQLVAKCVPWSGLKQNGSPCNAHTECQAGLFCGFYCAKPCCRTDNKPCPSACNFEIPFAGGNKAIICNLAPQCTLFVDDACKAGVACHFEDAQGVATCTPLTGKVEEPTNGKACEHLNDCENMQVCFGSGLNKKCRFNCDLKKQSEPEGKGGCPPGEECIQYNPTVELYPDLGYCSPAP